MKKGIKLLMVLCLLVFTQTGYADTSHSPPLEGHQMEMTIEQNLVMESLVLTPINFVEVEISPGDMLSFGRIYNKIEIKEANTLQQTKYIESNKSIYYYESSNTLKSNPTKRLYLVKVANNKIKKGGCLLLFSIS